MKSAWFSYFVSVLFASVLGGIFLWFGYPTVQSQTTLLSPIPAFLTVQNNAQVSSLALFLPEIIWSDDNAKKPEITAKAALLYDVTTKKTLYTKNEYRKLPMASLTKVMTAIIALEHPRLDNRYVVTKEALVGENTMGLTEGEVLTLEKLLYGLVLHSGNDAAEVLAINSPFGRTKFIEAMNKKVKALGLKNTHFTNPSGLQGDGDQYATAYDLLIITRYALENFPLFVKVAATPEISLPAADTHKAFYLYNETNLLTTYPGVKGVKTGYTPEAGMCLITYLDYKGHKIIGVLLGSENRRLEMKELLDYALVSAGTQPPQFAQR